MVSNIHFLNRILSAYKSFLSDYSPFQHPPTKYANTYSFHLSYGLVSWYERVDYGYQESSNFAVTAGFQVNTINCVSILYSIV